MSNVKVRVTNAVVDGNAHGSEIEVNEVTAKHLASLGYVEILAQAKAVNKSESAPKADKPATKPTTASRKKTKDDK